MAAGRKVKSSRVFPSWWWTARPGAEQPARAEGAEGAAEGEEAEEPPMGAEAEGDGEGDGEENNLSLSAMEAALKPQVLETFEKIAATYEKLHKIQESRLAAYPAR